MGILKTAVDVGVESPREDYPWRPIKVSDPYSAEDNLIHISPRSCLMMGLDVMGKYPVTGLGVDFRLSELDFVWLAVYFDANFRPIHAGVCKAPKWTRWYEYGGVSMGGFPRTVKTVRRDHVGMDIAISPENYAMPDIIGPEFDYVDFELEKEVEAISRQGYLYEPDRMAEFKKAMKSELTYFVKDPVQVKQWAAFSLLGYCTASKPDARYPFPFVELKKAVKFKQVAGKTVADKFMTYYYRQTATTHLMLQEVSAQGVRACQIVPSFPPYMEALPHPRIEKEVISTQGNPDDVYLWVTAANGIEGTLPTEIAGADAYEGTEKEHGSTPLDNVIDNPEKAGNRRIILPEPGENSKITDEPLGVLGAHEARVVYFKAGGSGKYLNGRYVAPAVGSIVRDPDGIDVVTAKTGHRIKMTDVASVSLYMMKERCLDSETITITHPAGSNKLFYSSDQTSAPIEF